MSPSVLLAQTYEKMAVTNSGGPIGSAKSNRTLEKTKERAEFEVSFKRNLTPDRGDTPSCDDEDDGDEDFVQRWRTFYFDRRFLNSKIAKFRYNHGDRIAADEEISDPEPDSQPTRIGGGNNNEKPGRWYAFRRTSRRIYNFLHFQMRSRHRIAN